ncbi:MAG: anti-sigma factor family protein [Nitrospiraceae bacterium]
MYSCDQVMAELLNFLDDQVAAEIRRELEVHLAHCRTCQALYDSARKTLTIVTDSRSFELPENISSRILEKIMSKVRGARRRRPKPSSKPRKRH